jgi:hypothetical protein
LSKTDLLEEKFGVKKFSTNVSWRANLTPKDAVIFDSNCQYYPFSIEKSLIQHGVSFQHAFESAFFKFGGNVDSMKSLSYDFNFGIGTPQSPLIYFTINVGTFNFTNL